MEESKLKALVGLIDDKDNQAFGLIRSKIVDIGAEIMPFLLEAQDETTDEGQIERLKGVYNAVSLQNAIVELRRWQENNYKNLFQGLAIISKFQYPKLEISSISNLLNKIRQDFWLEINDNQSPIEKIKILNHIFFNIYSFEGNTKDYYAVENSFVNDVLLTKKGSPLLLSVLYSVIAQSLEIPLYGVNTPRNFMLVYLDKMYSFPIDEVQDKNVLFYINPFSKGEIHSLKDIFSYLKRINYNIKTEYYLPCSNPTIVRRSINNIIVSLGKKEESNSIEDYKKLLEVLE